MLYYDVHIPNKKIIIGSIITEVRISNRLINGGKFLFVEIVLIDRNEFSFEL